MLSNPPFGVEWKKIKKEIEPNTKRWASPDGLGQDSVSDGSLLFVLIGRCARPNGGCSSASC